jgi:hypothetical protein
VTERNTVEEWYDLIEVADRHGIVGPFAACTSELDALCPDRHALSGRLSATIFGQPVTEVPGPATVTTWRCGTGHDIPLGTPATSLRWACGCPTSLPSEHHRRWVDKSANP